MCLFQNPTQATHIHVCVLVLRYFKRAVKEAEAEAPEEPEAAETPLSPLAAPFVPPPADPARAQSDADRRAARAARFSGGSAPAPADEAADEEEE